MHEPRGATAPPPPPDDHRRKLLSAERPTFFTDAVVAIAMTLLILPLLESVAEAGSAGLSLGDWYAEHVGQVWTFALSFALVAAFWTNHHSLFEHVGRVSQRLLWVNTLWMLMIVWLPVSTSMTGSHMVHDEALFAVYVVPMLVASLVLLAMHVLVRRDPRLWSDAEGPNPHGVTVAASMSVLYVLALVIGILTPAGYFAMFVLSFTALVESILFRRMNHRAR